MTNLQSRRGFAHFFVLGMLAVAALVIFISVESVSRKISSSTNVLGRYIAEQNDGDSSRESSVANSDDKDRQSSTETSTRAITAATSAPRPTLSVQEGKSPETRKVKDEDKEKETFQKKMEHESETEIENEVKETKTSKIEVENNEGKLEVKVHQGVSSTSAVFPLTTKTRRIESLKLKVKEDGQKKEVELNAEGDKIKLQVSGVAMATDFPISFDKAAGQLQVTTPNGLRTIRVLPDKVSAVARAAGVQNQIEKIELVKGDIPNSSETVIFKISGKRTGNLLGFIPINSKVESAVGAESGKLLWVNQPFWLQLLSPFIR